MRKLVLVITLFTLLSFTAGAQDIITKTNADEIEARITEVTPTEIKYKRFSNPDGPTYTISRSDVFMIKYQNGEKETFSTTNANNARAVQPVQQAVETGQQTYVRQAATATSVPVSSGPVKPIFGVFADYGIYAQSIRINDYSGGDIGPTFSVGANMDIPIPSTPDLLIGMGMGVRFTSMEAIDLFGPNVDTKLTQMNIDAHMIAKGRTRFGYKVGLRFAVPLSYDAEMPGGKADLFELVNPFQVGMIADPYWQFGSTRIGFEFAWMFTNFLKAEGSGMMTSGSVITFFTSVHF